MATKSATVTPERQSTRGRRMRDEVVLRPIDQIPQLPGVGNAQTTGAWAYYLRLDGATITDVLVLSPNGGVPDVDDPRLRARYGENSEYYRQRNRRRGLEYVGPTLTEEGMRRLVEVMEANRDDERSFIEEEIADANVVIKEADDPQLRQQARRRLRQFQRRLDTLLQPFDTDAVLAELNDIARAQMLAKIDPNIMRVMRAMIGEVNEKLAEKIAYFQQTKPLTDAPAKLSGHGGDRGAGLEGSERIDL